MGKAIQDAKVKVGGQAGPMGQGQGVPLTQAVGQGGLQGAMDGKPIGPNTQVPGAKGLQDRAQATGRMAAPGQAINQPKGMGVPNTGGGYAQSKLNWLQQRGGLFKGAFGKLAGNKQFNQLLQKRQGFGDIFRKSGVGVSTPPGQRKSKLWGATHGQPMGGEVTQLGQPTHGGLVNKPIFKQ